MHLSASTYLCCNTRRYDREQQMLLIKFVTLQIYSCLYTLLCPFPGTAPHPHFQGPVAVGLYYAQHQQKDLDNCQKKHGVFQDSMELYLKFP